MFKCQILSIAYTPPKHGRRHGSYSYIRVQTPEKQLISKEIDCAEPEYTNMSPHNYQSSYGPAHKHRRAIESNDPYICRV